MEEFYIVFPEGDTQEVPARLPFNTLVDMNGNVLSLPIPTNKMIVFRVARIKTNETKGLSETLHFLELMSAEELLAYTKEGRTVLDDRF
ncbi:hypothetical protein AGMMS50230_13230 [Spirochaetia bacterium]|nr:hypothetical protein AGMMS50230_13230 [Spirochaetia bacterium]